MNTFTEVELNRFWSKVHKTGTCWLWTAAHDTDGYGNWALRKKMTKPHRFSYELHKGKIPVGLVIDHTCRVRDCVNPSHLRVVTNKVNVLIGESPVAKNARKTHCIHGHELTGKNLYTYNYKGNIFRYCIKCLRDRTKAIRLKRKNGSK